MNRKIIFLDIDGTLCNDEGFVPKSAAKAIIKARKNGHKVYLCTGRARPAIDNFIMEIGFDGVIGASGGYLESDGEIIYNKHIDVDILTHLIMYFNKNKVNFYLEANSGIYGSENLIPQIERCFYGDLENDENAMRNKINNPHPFLKKVKIGENLYRTDINKVCFLESENVSYDEIEKNFEKNFEIYRCTVPVFGENSGELVIPGTHKAVAIQKLLDILGADKKDTIAFGDGANDAEMIEYCAIGIAMGNSKKELKLKADEITDTPDGDGIYKSLKKHKII